MSTRPAGRGAFIVDTNVLVAGLTTNQPSSPVAKILDAMLQAPFPFVLSHALLAEYRAVLVRPKLRALHGLSGHEIDEILTEIAQRAIVLRPQAGDLAPDPGDRFLWDLLATRADLFLVTCDKRLQRAACMRGRVITPSEFVANLSA